MAYDKQCAKSKRRRIPEKTLFLATACFGGLGGVLGMMLCRHKTKHWYFRVFFPVLMILQIALLVLAFVFLHEEFTTKSLIGCALIGDGTLLMVL